PHPPSRGTPGPPRRRPRKLPIPPTPTSTRRRPTSAAAPRTSASAPLSIAPRRERDMSAAQITRREFLETAGVAGLVIGFHLPAAGRQAMRGAPAAAFAPNAWLRIGADESVLVVVDRSEMGQGVTTSLPMLL